MKNPVYKFLKKAIKYSDYLLEQLGRNMPADAQLEEICTIVAKGGRRFGHTTAMAEIINREFTDVVVVCWNNDMVNHVKDVFKSHNVKCNVSFVSNVNDVKRLSGSAVDAIIIDCYSYLSREPNKSELLKLLKHHALLTVEANKADFVSGASANQKRFYYILLS